MLPPRSAEAWKCSRTTAFLQIRAEAAKSQPPSRATTPGPLLRHNLDLICLGQDLPMILFLLAPVISSPMIVLSVRTSPD
ncbi:unnamed protein product [Linum trigynum]|uniref:Uncharacterized protein n=1 Tax=Linum trigynum TaxID=586398 RepID=A0AAV2CVS6_9ROSI